MFFKKKHLLNVNIRLKGKLSCAVVWQEYGPPLRVWLDRLGSTRPLDRNRPGRVDRLTRNRLRDFGSARNVHATGATTKIWNIPYLSMLLYKP